MWICLLLLAFGGCRSPQPNDLGLFPSPVSGELKQQGRE